MSWFGQSPGPREEEEHIEIPSNAALNAPRDSMNGGGSNTDWMHEKSTRQDRGHHRYDSFEMELADRSSIVGEQPQKVLDSMFTRPVVDSLELQTRIRMIREREDEEHIAPGHKAPMDPESTRYLAWLATLVVLGSFSIATTGYYICMYPEFKVCLHTSEYERRRIVGTRAAPDPSAQRDSQP